MALTKKYLLILLLFLIVKGLPAQQISWATKLISYSKKYSQKENPACNIIGVPGIYPSSALTDHYLSEYEGYKINFAGSTKKNIISVGFEKAILAQQLILGGIYNNGSIYYIKIIREDSTLAEVYHCNEKYSTLKFSNFNVFFESQRIIGAEIAFDHQYIHQWNLVRGIGAINTSEPIDLIPPLQDHLQSKIKKQPLTDHFAQENCLFSAPKIADDGKTLFLTRHCENAMNKPEICYSILNINNAWGDPVEISFDKDASINKMGILQAKTELVNLKSDTCTMYAVQKNRSGNWEITNQTLMPTVPEHYTTSACKLENNHVMILAATSHDQRSESDLFMSFFDVQLNQWTIPINMGHTINTPFAESFPYLTNGGTTLYFSSKGHPGYGGFDVFETHRLDETWTNWSKPVNLGSYINTHGDDTEFIVVPNENTGYVYSPTSLGEISEHIGMYKIYLPVEFFNTHDKNMVKATRPKEQMVTGE